MKEVEELSGRKNEREAERMGMGVFSENDKL